MQHVSGHRQAGQRGAREVKALHLRPLAIAAPRRLDRSVRNAREAAGHRHGAEA